MRDGPEPIASRLQQSTRAAAQERSIDAAVLNGGEIMQGVEEFQLPHRQQRWIERTSSPLYEANGNVVGVQVLCWDVTERERAQQAFDQERSLLKSLMDNIPDAMYFKDKESRFIRISKAKATRSPDANALVINFGLTRDCFGEGDGHK